MNVRLTLAGAILGVTALTAAYAQTMSPPEAAKARTGKFRELGAAFKTVNDELRKPKPLKIMLTSATAQMGTSLREARMLFVPGSGPGAGVETKAKPEIWQRRADFDAKFARSIAEADKLAALARGGDPVAIGAQRNVLGGTCKDCHDQYRNKVD